MTIRGATTLAVLAIIGLGADAPAHAALTGWEEVIVPAQEPGYTQTLTLTKFDTSLGALQKVTLRLIGEVGGDLKYENLNAVAPAAVTATLKANLSLEGPLGTVLASAAPTVQKVETLAPADGLVDFDGPAGRSYLNQSALDGPVYFETTDPGDLAAYAGPGSFNLFLRAENLSGITGGLNFNSQLTTTAGAQVAVRYEFAAPPPAAVPEPGGIALLGIGGGLVVLARRRGRRRV